MPKIFISYRRKDSLLHAGRIFDQLALKFDPNQMFMDFAIPTGGDFPQILRDAVTNCDVCLVIIGEKWGEILHQRTLENADDWVRFEVRMALDRYAKNECVVMPILVGGATMPDPKFVPEDMRKLLDLNGLSIRDAQRDFHNDIAQLVMEIQAVVGSSSPSKNQPSPPPPSTKIDASAVFKAFVQARNAGKWDEARQHLAQLRSADNLPLAIASGLDEDEKDLWDAINAETFIKRRDEEYDILRLRATDDKKRFRTVYDAFRKAYPDYDPDVLGNLASRVYDILPQPFEWVHIPAGKVTLITKKGWSKNYIPEGASRTFDIPAFDIAKYPITNAQYDVFVNHPDGYKNPKWWDYSDEAKEWRVDRPEMEKSYFDGADCPRETVSWYDSVAFCLWLSAMTDEKIMLPTEQQWQRAAIGDTKRVYPWGDTINEMHANYNYNIHRTTPVTQYPNGASRYGVMDMAGNVWEWCVTEYTSGDNRLIGLGERVLRGGTWNDNHKFVNSVFRYKLNHTYKDKYAGFRCVRLFD